MRIGTIGLVNFDSLRLDEICSEMEPGEIVSNQVQVRSLPSLVPNDFLNNFWYLAVQFSIIDRRPQALMGEICRKHGVKILAYGALVSHFIVLTFHFELWHGIQCFLHIILIIQLSLSPAFLDDTSIFIQLCCHSQCGGFLSERWLGLEQPDPYFDHLTPSQRKVSSCPFICAIKLRPYFLLVVIDRCMGFVSCHFLSCVCVVPRCHTRWVGRLGTLSESPSCPSCHR